MQFENVKLKQKKVNLIGIPKIMQFKEIKIFKWHTKASARINPNKKLKLPLLSLGSLINNFM
jgi:hypothetical protein